MLSLSEPVQVQIIITFGVILSAIVTTVGVIIVAQLNRTRQHAKAASDNTAETRNEVKNSHTVNLRDDLDEKFETLTELVRGAISDIGGMKSDIRGIRREAVVDREAAAEDRKHIRVLEDTLTPAQLDRVRRQHKKEN